MIGRNSVWLAVAMGAATVWSFLVPDAPTFQRPELARIFFWHFPFPMLLTGFLAAGVYFSWRYFQRWEGGRIRPEADPARRREWDARASAALELGFLYAILTMLSGIVFSLAQWGAWWQWDPRQTSFLLTLLVYAAYFALRGALPDEERRAANSAAYILAASLPVLFLIFVFPRLPQIARASFHPTQSIMSGQIKGQYAYVLIALLILVTALSVWLYRLRVRVALLEIELSYGNLEASRRSASPPPVVRPVRIPDEGGA